MKKTHAEAVDPESLDVIVGGKPVVITGDENAKDADAPKEPVKQMLLGLLAERYGIEEEDLLSA